MKLAFDIVGDIHGHGNLLEKLLLKLGYSNRSGVFSNPKRKAIFCGDFIDRGPQNIKAVDIVMKMCANGEAFAIPGNHDLAYVQYHTNLPGSDQTIIPKNPAYDRMFISTSIEFNRALDFKAQYIDWIKKLPLFIENEYFAVYHGFRSENHKALLTQDNEIMSFNAALLNFEQYRLAIDLISKSVSAWVVYREHDTQKVERIRIKWWKNKERIESLADLFMGKSNLNKITLVESELNAIHKFYPYSSNEKPLFLGHFCMREKHGIVQSNICIIDLCVIKTGRLAAYRFDGESILQKEKIVFVQ